MRWLLVCALAVGCSDPDPVDLRVADARILPDRGPDLDQGPVGDGPLDVDGGPPIDGGGADLGQDASGGDGAVDDDGGVDGGPDQGPPGAPPRRDQIVVLSSRDDAWIAWVSAGGLYAARMQQNAEAVDEPVQLAALPGDVGALAGFRLTRPWVVVADGEGGRLRAYDVTRPDADRDGQVDPPMELELWPPVRVLVESGEALIVGRTGPEPEAAVGWRRMSNRLTEIQVDSRGFPVPQALAYGLQGWIFGFEGDTCLDATPSAEIQGPWRCFGRPGARLLGAGTQLLWVGPTESGLGAWIATPGAAVPAEGADADGDLLVDAQDNCPLDANPDQFDTDGDGTGDACQLDDDRDGIPDEVDNCPLVRNPPPDGEVAQLDLDGDGLGDSCDADLDGDGVPNDRDNCPTAANADQADGDGDRLGNACDMVVNNPAGCPAVPAGPDLDMDGLSDYCDDDDDGDGFPDADDNCPRARAMRRGEVDQADVDGDGVGDLCDGDDRDGDGVPDTRDTCPDHPNSPQIFGQSCTPPPPARLTLAPGARLDTWLTPPTVGQLALVVGSDNAPALWWLRRDRTVRLQTVDLNGVLGLFEIKTDQRLLGWSEPLNRPIPLPTVLEPGPMPPVFSPPAGCGNVAPESCGDRDADCDDRSEGLCCDNNFGASTTTLGATVAIGRDWFAGISDEGLLMIVRQGTVVRQLSHPIGDNLGQRAREVASWEGVRQVRAFDNQFTRTALLVERDVPGAMPVEGQPVPTELRLLWFRGVDGTADGAVPCAEPLGITLRDAQMTTRVWCRDGAFDVTPAGAPVPVALPPGDPLQWWEPTALGQNNLILVARGEAHVVELWRVAEDGAVVLEPGRLPPEVASLTPEERILPFRPAQVAGGRMARVHEARLEIFEPGLGWQAVPGSGWPIEATISRHDPVAVSVGFARDPAGEDPALVNVAFKIHSLRGDATAWGLPTTTVSGGRLESFAGIGFGDYPTGDLDRPILVLPIQRVQGGQTTTSFRFSGIGCEPLF